LQPGVAVAWTGGAEWGVRVVNLAVASGGFLGLLGVCLRAFCGGKGSAVFVFAATCMGIVPPGRLWMRQAGSQEPLPGVSMSRSALSSLREQVGAHRTERRRFTQRLG